MNNSGFILLLKGIIDIFTWIHYLLHFLTLFLLVLVGKTFLLYITTALVILDSVLGSILIINIIPKISSKINNKIIFKSNIEKILIILISPIRGVVRGLAPLLWLINLIKSKFKGELVFHKTPRDLNNFDN